MDHTGPEGMLRLKEIFVCERILFATNKYRTCAIVSPGLYSKFSLLVGLTFEWGLYSSGVDIYSEENFVSLSLRITLKNHKKM